MGWKSVKKSVKRATSVHRKVGRKIGHAFKPAGRYLRKGIKSVGRSPITQKLAETAISAAAGGVPVGELTGALYNPGERARSREAMREQEKLDALYQARMEAEYRAFYGLPQPEDGQYGVPLRMDGEDWTARNELREDRTQMGGWAGPLPPHEAPPPKRGFFGGIGHAFGNVFGGR